MLAVAYCQRIFQFLRLKLNLSASVTEVTLEVNSVQASATTFEEEVAQWKQLRHPNVMKMYGACYAPPNLQLFVCEYISHGSLIEHVELSSMEKPTVWKFLYEAALGLRYLHERGKVHGDLRCSNILIGSDGLAKLSNFSLSGSMDRSDRGSTGVMGSIRWLAPEILAGEPASIASDIYSLGMCILEATTREKPWSCERERVVKKYKARWSPETDGFSFNEPDCPSRDARRMVWQMCSKRAAHRVNLSAVVDNLDRLAIATSSNSSQPEQEPKNDTENREIQELWLNVQAHMDTCRDEQYHRTFDQLNRVRECWQNFQNSNNPQMPERFHALLTDFYRIITMSPEQASIMRLSSTRATTTSMNSFYSRIESILTELGETTESSKLGMDRWQQQRREQIELFVSGVENTDFLLGRLQTAEERAVFLKTLKAEIDDPESKYTPAQLAVVKKAYADISRAIDGEDLSKLIPDWFIPRFELFVDGCCLGRGGFGCVYQAKWLGSDVVAKLLGSDSEAELFFTPKVQSSLSTLLDLSKTQRVMDSTKRGETISMFRHEVDIWFGFNHPHVIRLFGACHVGTPFFACEYATNGTLVKYLEAHPGKIWSKLHEAALGVQYLHSRKVVHGDLKGNNIVVGSDKKAKVTDFGLSSIAGNEAKPQVSGAWHWVAPECLPEDKKEPDSADKSPTFESDIYSLGMCIVEALHVVENVERVKAGKEPQPCLPWRGLDNFLVRYHATKGGLPSQPTVCSGEQWELVKQMCAFNPKTRVKISTVVDRLAQLANPRQTTRGAAVCSSSAPLDQICARDHLRTSSRSALSWLRCRLQYFSCIPSLKSGVDSSCVAEIPERQDPKAIPEVIADARGLLGGVQSGVQVQCNSVLTLYTSLWDRLEELSAEINDKPGVECHDAFSLLVAEATAATSMLQGAQDNSISSVEISMRCYALGRRLDKFCDAYHLLLRQE